MSQIIYRTVLQTPGQCSDKAVEELMSQIIYRTLLQTPGKCSDEAVTGGT
jgi:hypothetical protein